jgi:hypothetical protein
MVITVNSESFCETSCKGSFTRTHFTHQHDEVSWSNNTGYCTSNCMRITKI